MGDRYFKPGAGSSEHARVALISGIGLAVLLAGVLVAVAGSWVGHLASGGIGVGLSAVGAYMAVHPTVAYARARAQVKASAAAPPMLKQSPRHI